MGQKGISLGVVCGIVLDVRCNRSAHMVGLGVCGSESLRFETFEALLLDLNPPLSATALLDGNKTGLFIEVPGREKAVKCPQECLREALVSAELHGRVQEAVACTLAAQGVGDDEPSQMRALFSCVLAIDGNGAFDVPVDLHGPEAVASLVVSPQELLESSIATLASKNSPNPQCRC